MTPTIADNSPIGDDAARRVSLVRAQLLSDLDRWEAELTKYPLTRVTLWAGVYAKAFRAFEFLMRASTSYWINAAGELGYGIASEVGCRKSVDRLTVGQLLDVLRRLNEHHPGTTQDRISWAGNLEAIGRIVERRNNFAHGRLSYDNRNVEAARMLFSDLRTFTTSSIVMEVFDHPA